MEESEDFPGYVVRDRRWWAHPEEHDRESAQSPAAEAREPGQGGAAARIAALEAELAERDRLLRDAQAREREAVVELGQARARLERDARREIERARRDLVVTLLPVLDDLDRAIAAATSGAGGSALLVGVELVRGGFLDRLRSLGVERFEADGQRFDPARHEAVSTVPAPEASRAGLVAHTLRPGYTAAGETIRPAQVIVSRWEPRSFA
jgi:molecular chaperone GrpE